MKPHRSLASTGLVARRAAACALGIAALCVQGPAAAFPSYSTRTGQPCTSCHVDVAGNPQSLTANGLSYRPDSGTFAKPMQPSTGGTAGSTSSDLKSFTYSGSCLLKYDYLKFRAPGYPNYHPRFKLLFLQGVTIVVPAIAQYAHNCGSYPGDDGDWQSVGGR